MTENATQPAYNKPWAPVTDPQVGDIVRIKQVPGSRHASKRSPIWGVVRSVTKRESGSVIPSSMKVHPIHCPNSRATRAMTPDSRYWKGKDFQVDVYFRDAMPAPKKIPAEVMPALVKDRLNQAL